MFAALLILAQAAPAAAAVPLTPERADARCLAAFASLASGTDAGVQRASQLGALYFYGKLVGRNPGLDLKAAMLDASRMVALNTRSELQRCGEEMERSGQALIAVGNALGPNAPAPSATPTPLPNRSRR